jgi:hypothetical protein
MIEFFTDPWNLGLAQWTLGTIISALIQLVVIPVSSWIVLVIVTSIVEFIVKPK